MTDSYAIVERVNGIVEKELLLKHYQVTTCTEIVNKRQFKKI